MRKREAIKIFREKLFPPITRQQIKNVGCKRL